MSIDLNRGVTMKFDPNTGARICMYKDEPGVFRNQHGDVVADSLAARAGFLVKDLVRERRKRMAIAQSAAEIEAQFEEQKAVKTKTKVIAESEDGYRAEQQPFGRCWVFGPDGKALNDRPLTKEEAMHLFNTIQNTPEVSTDADAGSSEGEAPPSEAKGDKDGT